MKKTLPSDFSKAFALFTRLGPWSIEALKKVGIAQQALNSIAVSGEFTDKVYQRLCNAQLGLMDELNEENAEMMLEDHLRDIAFMTKALNRIGAASKAIFNVRFEKKRGRALRY